VIINILLRYKLRSLHGDNDQRFPKFVIGLERRQILTVRQFLLFASSAPPAALANEPPPTEECPRVSFGTLSKEQYISITQNVLTKGLSPLIKGRYQKMPIKQIKPPLTQERLYLFFIILHLCMLSGVKFRRGKLHILCTYIPQECYSS